MFSLAMDCLKKKGSYLLCTGVIVFISGCVLDSSILDINQDISAELTKISVAESLDYIYADNQTYSGASIRYVGQSGAPLVGRNSEIVLVGEGTSRIDCLSSDLSGESSCEFSSDYPGKKLIVVKKMQINNLAELDFKDPYSKVRLNKSTAFANGNDTITAIVEFKTLVPALNSGQMPLIKDLDPQLTVRCQMSDKQGVALCHFRSQTAKSYSVGFDNPNLVSRTTLHFQTSKIKVVDDRISSAPGSQAMIEVMVTPGQTPILNIEPPSGTNSICSQANAEGKSICLIQSSVAEEKRISVSSPFVSEEVRLSVIAADSNSVELLAQKDFQSFELRLTDGSAAPLVGFVPVVVATQSGEETTIICGASNTQGIALCSMSGGRSGEKEFFINSPFLEESITVKYERPFLQMIKPVGVADGISYVSVSLHYEDEAGNPISDIYPEVIFKKEVGQKEDVSIYCTRTDLDGNAKCYFTSSEVGQFKAQVTDGSSEKQELLAQFLNVRSKISLVQSPARADGSDTVIIEVTLFDELLPQVGVTPLLAIEGSIPVNINCSMTNYLGVATCELTSTRSGAFAVRVVDPVIPGKVLAEFFNTHSQMNPESAGSTTGYVAGGSQTTIVIDIFDDQGRPLVGVTPQLTYTGPGTLTWTCLESDSAGRAVCSFVADTPGIYTVYLTDPLIEQPIQLTFLSADQPCNVQFGQGTKTWIGPQFNDFSSCTRVTCQAGWYEQPAHTCREDQAPTGGSFVINANLPVTNLTTSILNVVCPSDASGVVYMTASEDPDQENWVPCAAAMSFPLSAGDGAKTIYMKFKDQFENKTTNVVRTVDLDTLPPAGGSCSILNTVNNSVTDPDIQLQMDCPTDAHGPVKVAASTAANPSMSWSDCVDPFAFTLPDLDGTYVVHLRFKDAGGQTTATDMTTSSVILDRQAPLVDTTVPNEWINILTSSVSVNATDAVGTVESCELEVQEALLSYGVPGAFSAPVSVLRTGDGCGSQVHTWEQGKAYQFRARATDQVGNVAVWTDMLGLLKVDTTPSSGGFLEAAGSLATNDIEISKNPGSDLEAGLSVDAADYGLLVSQAPMINGICPTYPTSYGAWAPTGILFTSSLDALIENHTYAAVSAGCHVFKFQVRSASGLLTEYISPTPVGVDTTGAVGTSLVATPNFSATPNINLSLNPGTDIESGLSTLNEDYALDVATATVANGVCGVFGSYAPVSSVTLTASTTSAAYAAPVDGQCYSFRYTVKNKFGLTTQVTSNQVVVDSTPPIDGQISVSSASQTTTTIAVAVNFGQDPESSLSDNGSDFSLSYRFATYSATAPGVGSCGAFGGWTNWSVSINKATTNYNFAGTQGRCYQFALVTKNKAGLSSVQFVTAQSKPIDYTYSWYQSGFGSCTGAYGTWQTGSWNYCSPTSSYSLQGWGSCSGGTRYNNYTCNVTSCNDTRSVSCSYGSGTAYQSVSCRRSDGSGVSDSYCNNYGVGSKPADSTSCSTSCNPGTQPSSTQNHNSTCSTPAPLTRSCCVGGGVSLTSPNGMNSCSYSWGDADVGSTGAASCSGTKASCSISGSCAGANNWSYTYICNNPAGVACSGGGMNIPSSTAKPAGCYCSWPIASGGSSSTVTGSCTNGGSVSATCDGYGTWTGISSSCP